MQGIQIEDTKTFMSKLLIKDTFNAFRTHEVSLTTFATFNIIGNLNSDFFDSDELMNLRDTDYALWDKIKPIMYSLIKGNKLPHSFKIVFSMLPENTAKIIHNNGININPDDVSGLFVTIKYENDSVTIITGTSLKVFTMDKSLEQVWDKSFCDFLKANEIPFSC